MIDDDNPHDLELEELDLKLRKKKHMADHPQSLRSAVHPYDDNVKIVEKNRGSLKNHLTYGSLTRIDY
ncbi:hypothetical protein HZH66_011679 [Vespula vulgaris]|uniref:Uncharacterized protein n=1 Tax=Vespula vulgaris TaxID=7454 RepID=A0A834JDE8_VESVU|nr:hypothetical protein HZH66_011679 [Vespula vulgaris]